MIELTTKAGKVYVKKTAIVAVGVASTLIPAIGAPPTAGNEVHGHEGRFLTEVQFGTGSKVHCFEAVDDVLNLLDASITRSA